MKKNIFKSVILFWFAISLFSILLFDTAFYRFLIIGQLFLGCGIINLIESLNKYKENKIYEKKYLYTTSKLSIVIVPLVLIIGGLSIMIMTYLKEKGFEFGNIIYILIVLSFLILWLIQAIRAYVRKKSIYSDERLVDISAVVTNVKVKNHLFSLARISVFNITSHIGNKSYIAEIKYSLNGKDYHKTMTSEKMLKKGDIVKIKVNNDTPKDVYLDTKPNIWLILLLVITISIIILVSIGMIKYDII